MTVSSVNFVSQKISKVRWRPLQSTLQKADTFVTGSWDDVNNSVKLWKIPEKNYADDETTENVEFDIPQVQCTYDVRGDVCDLIFADSETLLVALGSGHVNILKYHSNKKTITKSQTWDNLHTTSGMSFPCTGIASNCPDFATVGEEGNLNILRIGRKNPLRKFEKCDSSAITAVKYMTSHEICTTNKIAQLRIYDTRVASDEPRRILMSSETLVALESVDRHPSRPHVIATGGADGCVTTFDMRGNAEPVKKIEVHSMEVWECRFHSSLSESLFTCSEDGSVRKLNVEPHIEINLNNRSNQHPVDVLEILPSCGLSINSIDTEGRNLICGSDAESLSIVRNV